MTKNGQMLAQKWRKLGKNAQNGSKNLNILNFVEWGPIGFYFMSLGVLNPKMGEITLPTLTKWVCANEQKMPKIAQKNQLS